jgi:hypothetical protein
MISALPCVGRRERVSFPRFGLFDLQAKIDTGAYGTALHCHDIGLKLINGKQRLCFKLLDPSHSDYTEREQVVRTFSRKRIKNSFGDWEERFVISTIIVIGNRRIRTRVSLTDRAGMKHPVLIGRRLLKNKFWVDVAGENLLGSPVGPEPKA